MSHSYTTKDGTTFIHNPDMSGPLEIVTADELVHITGYALVEFMRDRDGGDRDQAREAQEDRPPHVLDRPCTECGAEYCSADCSREARWRETIAAIQENNMEYMRKAKCDLCGEQATQILTDLRGVERAHTTGVLRNLCGRHAIKAPESQRTSEGENGTSHSATPKYAVGDRVKVIACPPDCGFDYIIGCLATVTSTENWPSVYVDVDGHEGFGCQARFLEPYPARTMPAAEWKARCERVGEVVRRMTAVIGLSEIQPVPGQRTVSFWREQLQEALGDAGSQPLPDPSLAPILTEDEAHHIELSRSLIARLDPKLAGYLQRIIDRSAVGQATR